MPITAEAKKHAAKIARLLAKHYPESKCALDFQSPLQLLLATILAAQCTDVRVNIVTKTLFKKYPTAAHFAQAKLGELEKDIQSTGFFRMKAKNIQNCCKTILEKYDGQVPKTMDELVELPGVGRKTANVVLGTGYGITEGVVVDTHVGRLSRRLGLSAEKDPEKVERDMMEQFAKKDWTIVSHRLVEHGRRCCTARSPKCDECFLASICPRIGVT